MEKMRIFDLRHFLQKDSVWWLPSELVLGNKIDENVDMFLKIQGAEG
jgi:hypothetical protein